MKVLQITETMGQIWRYMPTLLTLLSLVGHLHSTTALPAPPSIGTAPANLRGDPSSLLTQSLTSAQLEQLLAQNSATFRNNRSPAQGVGGVSTSNFNKASAQAPVIESATLLSHIVSEGSNPFRAVAERQSRQLAGTTGAQSSFGVSNPGSPDLLPGIGRELDDDTADRLLLQLLAARTNQANNQNQFSQRLVALEPSNTIKLNGNEFGTPADLRYKATNTGFTGTLDDKVIITSLGGNARQITPSQLLLQSNTRRTSNLPINSAGVNSANLNTVTVGDLVRSLDGNNGIRVVSLGDLRNSAAVPQTQTGEAAMLQQLRNALISENIKLSDATLNQQNGLVGLDIGVPLSAVNQNLNDDVSTRARGIFGGRDNANTDGASRGTLEEVFPQIDDILREQEATSGSRTIGDQVSAVGGATGSVGVPLPGLDGFQQDPLPFEDTGSTGTVGGSDISVTLDDDDDDYDINDNYSYEFDDDLPPLPAQPPDVFRTGVSDILFTKGQWVGTLIGGLVDIGSSIGEGVSKLFNKASGET